MSVTDILTMDARYYDLHILNLMILIIIVQVESIRGILDIFYTDAYRYIMM